MVGFQDRLTASKGCPHRRRRRRGTARAPGHCPEATEGHRSDRGLAATADLWRGPGPPRAWQGPLSLPRRGEGPLPRHCMARGHCPRRSHRPWQDDGRGTDIPTTPRGDNLCKGHRAKTAKKHEGGREYKKQRGECSIARDLRKVTVGSAGLHGAETARRETLPRTSQREKGQSQGPRIIRREKGQSQGGCAHVPLPARGEAVKQTKAPCHGPRLPPPGKAKHRRGKSPW
jgi:hypothetical protein